MIKETHGTNGTNGADGEDGIGVKALVEEYYLSTSNTTQSGGSWQTTQPTWVAGKYIWTRSRITWTNNTTTYTSPILASSINKANETANDTSQNLANNYYTKSQTNSQINIATNEISQRIDKIEDLTNELSGTKTITLTNCVRGSLLEVHIYGNNSVFQQAYPLNNLYPQNNFYPYGDSRIVVTSGNTSKTYELGITEVLRQNGNTQDEYILEDGYAKVIRRINSDGTIKTNTTTQNIGEFYINLAEGTNTITIKNYSATLKVKYAIKSDYTEIFATQVQMNSSITQTAEEINLEVSKKVDSNEIISKINQSAEAVTIDANKISLNGKNINLTGDNVVISSNNFNVDKYGNMTCNDATTNNLTVNSGRIFLNDDGTAIFRIEKTNGAYLNVASDFIAMKNSSGNGISMYSDNNGGGYIQLSDYTSDVTQLTAQEVRSPTITQTSKAEKKKNFEKLNNALDVIKNIDIYKYNLKSEDDKTKKHIGFVIGENYNYSEEVTSKNNDGADIYSFVSLCCQAIKEQQEEIEKLRKEVEK